MAQRIAQGERDGFARYYRSTAGAPPRPTLLQALEAATGGTAAETVRLAVDLGCGTGRDALPMLRAGFGVTAIDREARALAELRDAALRAGLAGRLVTRRADFTICRLPRCGLLNASFALPLCPPARFARMWMRIRGALLPGALLACQLYGPRDGWADRVGVTVHDRRAVGELLAGLDILRLEEEESEGTTPRGQLKRWHIWHVVARRPLSACRS